MKKRLLSLVLCLVMVFSLVPFNALALDRVTEGYKEITDNTSWTNTTSYDTYADRSITHELYFKVGEDDYRKVEYETGPLYSAAGNSWTASGAVGTGNDTKYYLDADGEYAVKRKQGTLQWTKYTNQGLNNDLLNSTTDYSDNWWTRLNGNSFYAFDDNDQSLYYVYFKERGYVISGGDVGGYYVAPFYVRNSNINASNANTYRTTVNGLYDADSPAEADPLVGVLHIDNLTKTREQVSRGYHYLPGLGSVKGNKHYVYEPLYRNVSSTGLNTLYYTKNNSDVTLASATIDVDRQIIYRETLYKKMQDSGYRRLYYMDGNNRVYLPTDTTAVSRKILGTEIYSGPLYIYTKVPMDPVDPVVVTNTEETGDNGVALDKTLEENGNHQYDVTMTAWTNGSIISTSTETQKPVVAPMDIALVIDQSGSMATGDMGSGYAPETHDWTIEQATGGTQYYAEYNGTKYPVQYDVGYLYEKTDGSVTASDLIGWGDDAISIGANGAPTFYNVPTDYYVLDESGTPHKLFLITAGLFLNYGLYPYVYKSNSDAYVNAPKWEGHNYWVAVFDPWDGSDLRDNSKWAGVAGDGSDANSRVSYVNTSGQMIGGSDKNADSARLSYSWFTSSKAISGLYQVASTRAANQLYFVDASGERHDLGKKAVTTNTTVLTDYTLYKPSGKTRVQALREAVTDFMEAVQQNAQEYEVDHRVALMGFAGNVIPSYSTGEANNTVGYNGLADYTNTGLFNSGDLAFENYERITGYEPTTDQYINRHYYQKLSNGSYVPVRYMDGAWYQINLATGAKTQTSYSRSNWYEATYEGDGTSLSAQDYTGAIMSVNDNGAVNQKITDAIASFGANGGTYTSYGMTMAEQLYKALDDAGDTQAKNSNKEMVNRQRIIIVFTDGEPGSNGYNASIAGEALVSGNLAKTAQGAKVFTVGLFKSSPSAQVTDFMKKLSSEYEMTLTPVYGGQDNASYSLGQLDPNQTYYYKDAATGKYYAVTTEYGEGNSLGWWIYNGSRNNKTTSYSITTPKRSSGGGTTVFYNASGSTVNGEDVQTGTTYYTANGDKIVYEYRWFDSDRGVTNPKRSESDNGSVGENRYQFYALTAAVPQDTQGRSYYMTASNAVELEEIFGIIADTLIQQEVTLENNSMYDDETTYLMDEISADFDLPEGFSANDVQVYMDFVTDWNEDGSPKTWGDSVTLRNGNVDAIEQGNADVTVTVDGKKITVEHFDWARHYVQQSNTRIANSNAKGAARLRVVIPNLTPNKTGKLYSNTPQSGMYYTTDDSTQMVEPFPMPSVVVNGVNVTWYDEDGTTVLDKDEDLLAGKIPVYDGAVPAKDATHDYTYTFKGFRNVNGGDLYTPVYNEAGSITGWQINGEGAVVSFPAVAYENVSYKAEYNEVTIVRYVITWKNSDDTVLETDVDVDKGTMPEYNGAVPEVPASQKDEDYTYFFAGWSTTKHNPMEDSAAIQAAIQGQPHAVDGNQTYYAVYGMKQIGEETMVYSYGVKNVLKQGVSEVSAISTPSGVFDLELTDEAAGTGDMTFTPGVVSHDFKYDFTAFSTVNTALYTKGGNSNRITVVPAADVYYSDQLSKQSVSNNAVTQAQGNLSSQAQKLEDDQAVTFTFTGKGIDVYCTTNSEQGYVQAVLYDSHDTRVKMWLLKNYSETERYNVPSISYIGQNSDTYTLKLFALEGSNYTLDGVRIYQSISDPKLYKADTVVESNATFTRLRSLLLTDKAQLQSAEGAAVGYFLDKSASDEGTVTYTLEDYRKDGPKSEIYLDPGQAIGFTIVGYKDNFANKDIRIQVGLSAPDADSDEASALISRAEGAKSVDTLSALDVYYTVTPDENGNVMIVNTSDEALISVTNLKVSGKDAPTVVTYASYNASTLSAADVPESSIMYLTLNEQTVSYAKTFKSLPVVTEEDPGQTTDPTETPEPTHQPTLQDLIRQIVSSFVSNLFKSIARLFGN